MVGEKNSLQASQASNRDVSAGQPGPKQDCSDVVHIAVFFDGTGNNKDVDEPLKKWANPARMYVAAQIAADLSNAIYPIYVSGVGTPFNGTASDWLDKATVTFQDDVVGGLGGAGGTRRTEFGKNNVNETLRRVLLDNAKKLNATTKAYAEKSKTESLGELSKVLEAHRLIKMINLSVFGFSRGAALARAFSNDFLKDCKADNAGKLTYQGFPIRLHFMGLFDTVASFGGPSMNMNSPFTEKNLKIPGAVERCVHFVAGHELRFSFPVDLIRQHGQLMPNWTEVVYPGVHSDVGGGYTPVDQGRSNNYARIPMRDMMNEAVKSGVRLLSYDDIATTRAALFAERFKVEPETESAYNRYRSAVPANGSIEQQVTAHMRALYSAYGTMSRRGISTPDNQADIGHRLVGHASMAREVRALRSHRSAAALLAEDASTKIGFQFMGTAYGQIVKPDAWRLKAWDSTASEDVLTFVGKYVHDSKAGFLAGIEPFSYFRPRGMTEASRNVLEAGKQWLDDNLQAVTGGVIKVYASAKGIVVETWQAGVVITTTTYQVGERFVLDTVEAGQKYAVEVYQTTSKIVVSKVDEGQKAIITSVDVLQKETLSAVDALRQKAASLSQQVQQGASSAVAATGKAVDSGMQAVEDSWQTTKAALGL
ncbi:T6SS phospholipase effector Tle1-like catalytic domain-containing protein [Paraburkholderia sabiae]|uniref:DUF2235 domain-containing protein n=1 Tax=Paraburkholderia sabiae TaxID=273251 RepID=A0ABU9Q8E8_9BURK|nr:DUF2235 domain-containing protein [Paraburkholderia sabiae]WJZ77713.1 DUF2235 domain-containing protein [Paraburkholderia sabiae]CAD6532982.1 hypothetical protein LMG24235_02692 [Paraburkholderia sabiae]